MKIHTRVLVTLVAMMLALPAWAAAQLSMVNAWIPQAPPGAGAMAGYLTISNGGDAAVDILAAQSDRFRMVSIHETVIENGVARMRELTRLELAPGKTVQFKPGGLHLMLMQPRSEVMPGEHIEITFLLSDGQRLPAIFEVQAADADAKDDHAGHEH
ncbi:MAG: copper chaperone PCu(A)C [Dokdonella sp.]|jgi:copper(I)-binding protein|uniref:copper chaperone PCu(A)C n=1 Tax=Dokdonella sp. TaxID=2291710 RepID=UPI0025C06BD4|nr:copper chaperone PCu(A)C [Dokdonella sp.]MBK8124626.1 copper chaperone PCu(A)C [Dokdonella sp.]